MEMYFKVLFSTVSGFILKAVGGYDIMISTLTTLVVLDFVTGVFQALRNHEFKARICADGIIRKIFIYLTVALAVCIETFMGGAIPLREITIVFYIVSEGMSCLENIGKVVEYPEQLKKMLAKLNEDNSQK